MNLKYQKYEIILLYIANKINKYIKIYIYILKNKNILKRNITKNLIY